MDGNTTHFLGKSDRERHPSQNSQSRIFSDACIAGAPDFFGFLLAQGAIKYSDGGASIKTRRG
jgi:hypothetical protein